MNICLVFSKNREMTGESGHATACEYYDSQTYNGHVASYISITAVYMHKLWGI